MHSQSQARESSQSPPLDVANNLIAASARARAIGAGRSAWRIIAALSPLSIAFVTFRCSPHPFPVGSETPSITTPYTECERVLFRRSDKSIVVSVPKFPTFSQMCNWKTRLGHGLTAVSRFADQAEYGWSRQINRTMFGELGGRDNGSRLGAFDVHLALALYKICPPIFQKCISDKEADAAKSDDPKLLAGRHLGWMVLDRFKQMGRVRTTFTS